VNAVGWDASEADAGRMYQPDSLPSERMIVDLSDLNSSLSIHPTGQSGHAYHPHYTDMIDLWRNIQYHAMLWDRAEIESGAEGHLQLMP
jgi:penicillin amidase